MAQAAEAASQMQLEWAHGFPGKASYITEDTLMYKSGNKIVFLTESGFFTYHVPDLIGIGKVACHPINKVFAISTLSSKPKILIYEYPDVYQRYTLDGKKEAEILSVTFSYSLYVAVITGVPEYKLSIWNYTTSEVLISVDVLHETPNCLTFNPTNWREICISYAKDLHVWHISQSSDQFFMRKTNFELPYAKPQKHKSEQKTPTGTPRDKSPLRGKSRDGGTRTSYNRNAIRVHFDIPQRSVAGVDGEDAAVFFRYKDKREKVMPVSHVWLPNGTVAIGCAGGQLLKVDLENSQTSLYATPGLNLAPSFEDAHSRASSASPAKANTAISAPLSGATARIGRATLHAHRPSTPKAVAVADSKITASEETSDDKEALLNDALVHGSLDFLALHKNGIFAAGADGVLRRLVVKDNKVTIAWRLVLGAPALSLQFNNIYNRVMTGLATGGIHIHEAGVQVDNNWMVMDHGSGPIVAVEPIFPGTDVCLSARENGTLQMWSMEETALLHTWSLGARVTSLATGTLASAAAVGTDSGHVYIIDTASTTNPRTVARLHLHKGPVRCLHTTRNGFYLLTASDDGHIFLIDFRATNRFPVLGHFTFKGEVQHVESFLSERTGNTKVVATAKSHGNAFLGANKIIHFTLPGDLLRDITRKHGNLLKEFKEDVTGALRFNLANPAFGLTVADSNTIFVIGQNNKTIQKIALPTEPPKKEEEDTTSMKSQKSTFSGENSKDSYLYPSAEYVGHQLSGGFVGVTFNGKWLVSAGKDGRLLLRSMNTPERVYEYHCQDYLAGGTSYLSLTPDGQRVLTAGFDGTLCCYKFMILEVKGKTSRQVLKDFLALKQDAIDRDRLAVMALPVWNPPSDDGSYRPSSAERRAKEQEKKIKQIEEAIEKDELYETPPLVLHADATWLENVAIEAHKQEDQNYADLKKDLRTHIREMRRKLQEMLKQNNQVPEIEKLSHHEFDLDVEEQVRLEAAGDAEVKRIKEEKELENLAKMYLAQLIRQECWDNMEVKGRTLCSLKSQWEVSNYPLKPRSKKEVKELETVCERRKIELYELEKRKEVVEVNSSKPKKLKNNPELEELMDMDPETKSKLELLQFAISGSLGAAYGGDSELFYTQFELYSREQKQVQIVLLKDAVYRMKQHFNKAFSEMYAKKESEIAKVKEKNKRIKKILQDLSQPVEVWEPELNMKEKPEQLLIVKDDEITVEKYLTPEERRLQEEREKEEAERLAREKKDNWRERGLDQMMGGVLEIRKEDELKKDIPKPPFMATKTEVDYTDEEKKQVIEYERKVKELNEEREKFRKQLEQELKKLQNSIEESVQAFDDGMKALFYRKIKTEMAIFQEELKMVRLKASLLLDEEAGVYERSLHRILHMKRQSKVHGQQQLIDLRKRIEQFKDQYELQQAEDKVMDKEFKRRFTDVPLFMQEQLYKLFKRRPRGQKARLMDLPGYDQSTGNPYWDRPSTAHREEAQHRQLEAGLSELDSERNMPEGMDPDIWARFCNYRRQKVESESNLKMKAQVMAEMEAFYKQKQSEDQQISSDIEKTMDEFSRLREDKQRHLINLEVQLLLKQGQVEVDPGYFLPDYSHCALIHRSTVEDLNTKINELGKSKIQSMMESKDFRKGIVQREWEKLKNTMEMEDLRDRMRDIQMMKVTREIQKFLGTPDYDTQIQKTAQTLEQTLNLLKEHHQKKLDERQSTLKETDRIVRRKIRENHNMTEEIEELNLKTHERKHICPEDQLQSSQTQRYNEIIQRRKLVELAKAQAQEVAVLRAEVERLRMRTFPALVQVDH